MFRVAVESILGLRVRGGKELQLNPCISVDWPRVSLSYREPRAGGRYEIVIKNPDGREKGVRRATVDGLPATVSEGVAAIPLFADGAIHRVTLHL
jgi:cellobiose phosphorylase